MTAADWIARRKALADAATDGPWEFAALSEGRGCVEATAPGEWREIVATETVGHGHMQHERIATLAPDAAFIADARTSLPQAVAALDAVLRICGEAEDDCPHGGVDCHCDCLAVIDVRRTITDHLGAS